MPPAPNAETDEYYEAIPTRVSAAEVRRLSRVDPVRAAGTIALHWAGIVAAIWLCERSASLPLHLVAEAWIGARQHALGVMMHDQVFRERAHVTRGYAAVLRECWTDAAGK